MTQAEQIGATAPTTDPTATAPAPRPALDDRRFRQVLGHYPTGVVVVTAIGADGLPIGMTIGSFTSVSLDPPLVAFLPTRSSQTFAALREATTLCVNVLAADQEETCRRFAGRKPEQWTGVRWTPSPGGAPILDGVVGWIECTTHDIVEAGDHFVVLGRVTGLEVVRKVQPLLFFQGGYGKFTPSSLVALPSTDLVAGVRLAEVARPEIDRLSSELGAQVSLMAAAGPDLVVVGAASAPNRAIEPTVGARIPLRPPLGDLYVAWQGEEVVNRWLDGCASKDEEVRESYRTRLATARQRGWSMSLSDQRPEAELYAALREYSSGDLTPERQRVIQGVIAEASAAYEPVELRPGHRYDVHSLVAPVFGPDGEVELVMRLSQLPAAADGLQVMGWVDALVEAANRVSAEPEVARIVREVEASQAVHAPRA